LNLICLCTGCVEAWTYTQFPAKITLIWVLLLLLKLMLLHVRLVAHDVANTPYLTTFHIIIYYSHLQEMLWKTIRSKTCLYVHHIRRIGSETSQLIQHGGWPRASTSQQLSMSSRAS